MEINFLLAKGFVLSYSKIFFNIKNISHIYNVLFALLIN